MLGGTLLVTKIGWSAITVAAAEAFCIGQITCKAIIRQRAGFTSRDKLAEVIMIAPRGLMNLGGSLRRIDCAQGLKKRLGYSLPCGAARQRGP